MAPQHGPPKIAATSSLREETADTVVRWTVTCRVLEGTLRPGDRLRIELPKSWHVGARNSARRVQASDATQADHISARVSRGQATLTCSVEGESADAYVKTSRTGLDGGLSRYAFVARVDVVAGRLVPGDALEILYGGAPGFRVAPYPQEAEPIRISVESVLGRMDLPLAESPRIRAVPGSVAEIVAVMPSIVAPGEGADLRIVALDRAGNLSRQTGLGRIVRVEGPAELDTTVIEVRNGSARIPIRLTGEGVVRVYLEVSGASAAVTNPSLVLARPDHRMYWGDLHSHATESFDGVGLRPFDYARDVACLDFYALTEHAEGWPAGAWERICNAVSSHHRDGHFVTLHAYEATFPAPWGHHNVYFRDSPGAVRGALDGSLDHLWASLLEGDALTVPHHTGVEFLRSAPSGFTKTRPVAIDWSHHHPAFRRLTEIYSAHGQCELFDRHHVLAYERSDFQFNSSAEGPHYAQDAWRLGHRLGAIASSDDHHGQPGRGEYGLVAVRARELSRAAIFDGLYARACYGTTGARMIIDLQVGDGASGQEAVCGETAPIRVRVHGTRALEMVEVVRITPAQREVIVARWQAPGWDLVADARDDDPPGVAAYYLRVRQAGTYRGRATYGWSGPVWVRRRDEPVG